jgi:hypothetical protein
MSYFNDGATVPPPFNVIPSPKSMIYLVKWFFHKFCGQTKKAKNEAMRTIRVYLLVNYSHIAFNIMFENFSEKSSKSE